MPELPEVEAVTRVAERALRGRRVVRAEIRRARICAPKTPAGFARALRGRRFRSAERRGKHIVLTFDGVAVLVHLRMTGDLHTVRREEIPAARESRRTTALLLLDDGRALVFDDPRGLGVMRAVDLDHAPRVLGALGLDPLAPQFTPETLVALARASRAAIKLLLMEQRRIAGLGNIYAAEALWEAGIDPRRRASSLSRARLRSLHAAIRKVLHRAVRSASRYYRRPGAFVEGEPFRPAVYDRQGRPCRRCGRTVRRITQGSRGTYFCPGCQR